MILIKDAMLQILKEGENNIPTLTKYAIAKKIDVKPIMIDRYLTGDVKSPQKRICVNVFREYGKILYPFNRDELLEELNKGKQNV